MNLFDNLALGLGAVMQMQHLLLLLLGCVLGALAVAVNRLGLLAMMAMLLPVMQQLDILAALMAMLGIYCGANAGVSSGAGGRSTDPASTGGGSPAGGFAADAIHAPQQNTSRLMVLLAGLIGAAAIALLAPLLIEQAFSFGPAEYFSLLALGMTASVVMAAGSLIKALATLVLGVMLAQVGVDPASSLARFSFDLHELEPGLGLIPTVIGVAVIARLTAMPGRLSPGFLQQRPPGSPSDWFNLRRQLPWLLRGSAIGSLLGPVPGGGVRLGSHVASAADRTIRQRDGAVDSDPADDPGSTTATAAGVRSSLVPMLAWGFPVNASIALIVGLMLDKQVIVGPQLMSSRPDLFWGSIAAVVLCSLLMFVAGGLIARLAKRAHQASLGWLPAIMVIFCCIGVYTIRSAPFDLFVMAAFALLGHWLFKFGCRVGPLIMGFVLGPALESNLRHALELSAGNWGVLITRPISAGLLLAAAALFFAITLPSLRQRRARIFDQED